MAAARGATGDTKNNLMKLLREVQRMKLLVEPDIQGLCLGAPSALLPILHHCLMHYSLPLASWLSKHDYELYGKNDLRFVEGVYKVLREVFHYHPRLTKEQFLTVGYVERKLQMVTDLLVACRDKHHQLSGTQQRGRRRGRASEYSSQRARHGPVNVQASKSEVLTVQSTSGISSAWTEPIAIQVQGPQENEVISLMSLEHSPPPHPLTPTWELELTPSPTPSPPPHSSPISLHTHSHKPQPIVVRHNLPEQASNGDEFKSGGTLDAENSRKITTPGENLSPLLLLSEERGNRGGTEEGKLEPPEGPPEQSELSLEVRGEESIPPNSDTQTGDPPASEQVELGKVNKRVLQLSRMVEKMSARCVLLETQLKTLQGTVGGGKEGGKGLTSQLEPTRGADSGVQEVRRETTQPHTLSPEDKTSDVIKGRAPHITSTPSVSTATEISTAVTVAVSKATVSHSNTRANFVRSDDRAQSTLHTLTSTPHHKHPVTAAERLRGASGTALSSQIARIRAEEQLPPLSTSPLPQSHTPSRPHSHTPSHPHPHSHTPSHPHSHTLSYPPTHSNRHTPKSSSLSFTPSPHSPSTPSDTVQMIAGLRDRAQKTREFLQRANKRL